MMAPKQRHQSELTAAHEQPAKQSGANAARLWHRPPLPAEGMCACGGASAIYSSYPG